MSYDYTISPFNSNQFTSIIQQSGISIALDHIDTSGSSISIFFKDDLSEGNISTLNSLVSSYVYVSPITPPLSIAVSSQPPYGSKTISINNVSKNLYARFTGIQFDVVEGSNTLTYTATYAWSKLIGVEALNCEALDTVNFKVYDTPTGTYSGHANILLNQFSYTLNLPKDYYMRLAQFDADLYVGMIIEITYVSKSNKRIGINFLLNEVK